MDQQQQASFEGYAVVEIMGHNREIGFVLRIRLDHWSRRCWPETHGRTSL
jgi:hypothetical protein